MAAAETVAEPVAAIGPSDPCAAGLARSSAVMIARATTATGDRSCDEDGACADRVDGACGEGHGVFGCGGCCAPASRFYASAEYLLWWTKGENLPPLVTAGSAADLATGANVGALGLPGTAVLFGGDDVNQQARSGARFMVGYWFGDEHLLGIEGGGFFLGRQTSSFTASSTGTPILTRPFFNVASGIQDSELVAAPGILAGTVTARTSSTFYGAEANLRSRPPLWSLLERGPHRRLSLPGSRRRPDRRRVAAGVASAA